MDATEAVRLLDWPRLFKPRFDPVIRQLGVHDNLAHPRLECHPTFRALPDARGPPTLRAYRVLEARAISGSPNG
jgi:hypothetical protein